MKSIQSFHSNLQRASKINDINDYLKQYLAANDIDTFVMTCYYKLGRKDNSVVSYSYVSDSFKAWHDYYHLCDYDQIDTTTADTKLSELPVFWEIHEQIEQATTKIERQMRLDALEFGADCGLSIPLHSAHGERAILMLAQKQGQSGLKDWQSRQYEFFTAGYYYYSHLKEKLLKENPQEDNSILLNNRQIQCLELISQNYRPAQIASKLNITERTVNYHIQRINKKLDTRNKHQSVVIGQKLGLIE